MQKMIPLVPPKLVNLVKNFVLDCQIESCQSSKVEENDRQQTPKDCLLIEQKYGGHLGFYEGGYFYPNELTWLDR